MNAKGDDIDATIKALDPKSPFQEDRRWGLMVGTLLPKIKEPTLSEKVIRRLILNTLSTYGGSSVEQTKKILGSFRGGDIIDLTRFLEKGNSSNGFAEKNHQGRVRPLFLEE